MFIRFKDSKDKRTTRVQIVETFREGKKTVQKILAHIGIAHDESERIAFAKVATLEMERIRARNPQGLLFDATDVLLDNFNLKQNEGKIESTTMKAEKIVIDGPKAVYGKLFEEIGLSDLLPGVSNGVLQKVVTERCQTPASKLAIAHSISEKEVQEKISEDTIYRMMDKLSEAIPEMKKRIRENTLRVEGAEIEVAFYDCTTLYFESACADDLRKFGFSKDSKHHQTQVVLALATTGNGMPLDYELFPGSTAEVTTLLSCLDRWKNFFKIKAITFVADRGLFSTGNLVAIQNAGYDFVVAAPLRKMNSVTKTQLLNAFYEKNGEVWNTIERKTENIKIEYEVIQLKKETTAPAKTISVAKGYLHVDFCQERYGKDKFDREQLVAKISKKLGENSTDPKKLVSNAGYKKYVNCSAGKMRLNEKKVAEDACWDGLHGIFTSLNLTNKEVRERYKRLWVIEQTFRIAKSNIKIRPVFHWKKSRIEAHIAICYISLAIVRSIELKLKQKNIKISFDKLNKALEKVGYCELLDGTGGDRYKLPIKIADETQKILEALGISYRTATSKI